MRIAVALDSFKGSLSAREACAAVRRGVLAARPDADVLAQPMADGGEGTAGVLLESRGGRWVPVRTSGPLPGQIVDSGYAWRDDDAEAVVEMAASSGLTLLRPDERDPARTTTYGTGELLRAAVEQGARRIRLAVGGSATVDGGTGAARALGWRFLDAAGGEIPLGGAGLEHLARMVAPRRTALPPIEVLSDVRNPLCGPQGAARVFAPQKGAGPELVLRLERGLEHLATLVREQLGPAVADLPGGGAAGGLAAGAVAFLGARIVSGIAAVIAATGFSRRIAGCDWVITGEGRFDAQSGAGKVVSGVARAARAAGVKVAVFAGSSTVLPDEWASLGVDEVRLLVGPDGDPAAAMREAAKRLEAVAAAWVRKRM